jgi:O-succinylbenzoic acid--CoA ligase
MPDVTPPFIIELPDWLTRRAATHGDQPALLCGDVAWSFAELHARVGVAAAALAATGGVAGERVALLARNSPAFVVTVHALGRLGAVLAPLNARLAPEELAWQLADCGAALLLHDDQYAALAEQAARDVAGVRLLALGTEGPVADIDVAPVAAKTIRLDAVQSVIYTSGTTGRPKGALLTWGNHWWNAVGSALQLGLDSRDRWLAPLPLFHVGGLAILMRSVIYGMPVILHERFDPGRANAAIDEQGATIISVVATMLRRMLDAHRGQPYPPSLRCVLLGGGPAPRPLREECARLGVPVAQTYGLTEAGSQLATLPPEDALRKLGSAGKPLLPNDLRIERAGAPVPAGEVGEIVVRGPSLTPGYLNRPEATTHAWRGGWFHTGDLGRLDADGYLYVLDRRDDLIVSGGENVYPAEVEAVLLAHPAIADAGVVGVPDAEWGQTPVAILQARDSATPADAEILAHCAARLARYKVPKRLIWRETLPRNAAGKLLRRALRDDVTAGTR